MLRPLLAITAAIGVAAGCITPARVAMVEGGVVERDTNPSAVAKGHGAPGERQGHSLSPAVVAAVPEVVAVPLDTLVTPPQPAPPAPVPQGSAFMAQVPPAPLTNPPPRNLPAATPPEQLPAQPPPPQQPPEQPQAVVRSRSIQDISLDIAAPPMEDAMLRKIAPPPNYGAEALQLLAAEQPFVRGDLINYGLPDNGALPPGRLDLCYQPLYFQELNAERYGRSWGIFQPAVSVANFYSRIPLLPYMAFAHPARRCTYFDHYALPGYRIPYREPYPHVVSPAGGVAQTAALFGVILLIP
jgi:hypothetical protein